MFNLFRSKKNRTASRILIVDDEPDYISTVRCRLEYNDYEVLTATNGREGLDCAIREKPNLILLDTSMPVMNGHEMLEQLRQNPETVDIPVIMVTAMCQSQDIDKASTLGIVDYVAKPFDSAELISKVAQAIKNTCSV